MRRSFRAAALTAAALVFGTAVGLAAPSFAYQAETAPAAGYIDHAGVALQTIAASPELGLNAAGEDARLSHDVDFSNQVATHAVAPAAPQALPFASEPEERNGRSLADLVEDYAAAETPDEETECLARAVYFESKGEPLSGQLTVAEVVINRSESGRFPASICGVVRQPSQFSFVRRGHIPQPPSNGQWRTAVAIARIAMQDLADGSAPRALFFHARHVRPGWRLTRVAAVGNHIFYR